MVETQRLVDEFGRIVYGEPKTGAAAEEAKALMASGTVDLSMLDAKVEELCAKILLTFPECTIKTIEELRKPKLEAWNRNKENSRAWLALNMMTEARSGFIAFNEGTKDDREADFVRCARSSPPVRAGSGRCTTRSNPRPSDEWNRSDGPDMPPLKDWLELDDALLRLRLSRPKANIVDAEMIAALHGALVAYGSQPQLRGVLLDAEGPHFSFGASVEEHLPAQCAADAGVRCTR